MLLPVEVTFRHMPPSESLEAAAREHAAKLDRFYPHITSCRIMIEVLHQRHFKGSVFHVRFDVTVPGAELVAVSEPPPQHFHEDVHIALREAYDRMRRELQDHARKVRGYVKTHAPRAPQEPGEEGESAEGSPVRRPP
jgi:ribosome-associated translation inhibitor RaiA